MVLESEMDPIVQKLLNDKLYDKRKSGALELENLIRSCLAEDDHSRIEKIVNQLCHDFAYAVHQPHARNGGLIGLAAASIALGSEVARYLEEIVPPVLACFGDQDARVRYYACESMYNIAKVAKGEILLYFNEVFDALCKVIAHPEPQDLKNGAELLDRLIKDIVSESAASYVSVLATSEKPTENGESPESHTAFSLSRFIPLLKDRITVLNPFTRMFLVSWVTLLDSIPDLELVTYLPDFLGGLFKFLSDSNQDVHTATQVALEKFLAEIKKIARLKRGLALSKRSQIEEATKLSDSSPARSDRSPMSVEGAGSENASAPRDKPEDQQPDSGDAASDTIGDDIDGEAEEDWIPGQDVQVDHVKILDILVTFLGGTSEQEIQLTALRWIDSFFEICPEDILPFVPRLLEQVLPALSSDIEQVRQAANRVNTSLMDYILSLPEEEPPRKESVTASQVAAPVLPAAVAKDPMPIDRRESTLSARLARPSGRETPDARSLEPPAPSDGARSSTSQERPSSQQAWNLDYDATVSALTLQFLNEHEATRVAALNWLIMLQRKAPPGRRLEINDGTFPALLKTLSDTSDAVVTRDLALLSQMFRNSDESKFTSFMLNLLKLFSTDRRLLETRGNLIIRQLCISLSAERIYRTLADCLEKDEDVEFASIMVQNLNNNLITAPELADLRKRLRNLDSRDGQIFFTSLFRSWTHNAVSTFSLCLLAQAYEQAYFLLQIFADLEMTLPMLIQIDKLVQLLESPVFTYLRLQLLEPERYPYLYKCLYGLLMLLPQSSAFAALKNRLNSVSAIGYLHVAAVGSGVSSAREGSALQPGRYAPFGSPTDTQARRPSKDTSTLSPATAKLHPGPPSTAATEATTNRHSTHRAPNPASAVSSFDRPNRLKSRDEGGVRWTELLEKFRATQERARRVRVPGQLAEGGHVSPPPPVPEKERRGELGGHGGGFAGEDHRGSPVGRSNGHGVVARQAVAGGAGVQGQEGKRHKSGLGGIGRFAGVGGRKPKR